MCKKAIVLMILALLLILPPRAPAFIPTSPSEMEVCLDNFGYEKIDTQDLLSGQIISQGVQANYENQLAVTAAMVLPTSLNEVVEFLRSGKSLMVARNVLGFRFINTSLPVEKAFTAVGFQPGESEEVSKLLKVEPGLTFNLSSAEIERFKAVGFRLKSAENARDPQVLEAVNREYRALLMARYKAYRQGGSAAVAPYDRGGGIYARPDKELLVAAHDATQIKGGTPHFHPAFLHYPQYDNAEVENQFLLTKERVEDRPTFILAHRKFRFGSEYAVMTERQFYVSHTYNSQQIIVGCVEVDTGTLLFYQNQTFTDRIVGFGSSLKRIIARELMRAHIIDHFKSLRRVIAQKN